MELRRVYGFVDEGTTGQRPGEIGDIADLF
jgi:hypothetical protein